MKMIQEPKKVEYEQFGSKWGFTAFFESWSLSCSGYESKSAAKAAFEQLKTNGFGGSL